ncbi:hypothetical protein GCM10007275_04140 [Jeotgalicoccus coquinae]|uniref:Uncharacterized protein n=2 Tax=Jeotgalicoccus coquinae TaxID=709509 RepID=A0A6V7R831_9STAP|nr:hypothetical protein [Jeotgalicoccus coquinae]GGE12100.1 hypothetical protein GCM10007275_04140 [Jeotgalicoccus coquinae]CAD2073647.1 hypothetical protein JEOCOQ751_00760 [Jeotgalicoccus coquinae]
MEEAWKDKENFTKEDPEVFFVLIVTGEYHYRRDNITGAATSYKRALKLYEKHEYDVTAFGFGEDFMDMIRARFSALAEVPFTPMQYPVDSRVYESLYEMYKDDYESYSAFTLEILNRFEKDEHIIHRHRLRDREDVIEARLEALNRKLEKRKR